MGNTDCFVTYQGITIPENKFKKIVKLIATNNSDTLQDIVKEVIEEYGSDLLNYINEKNLELNVENLVRIITSKIDNEEVINSNAVKKLYYSQFYYREITTLKKIAYAALDQLYKSDKDKGSLILARTLPNLGVHIIDKVDRPDKNNNIAEYFSVIDDDLSFDIDEDMNNNGNIGIHKRLMVPKYVSYDDHLSEFYDKHLDSLNDVELVDLYEEYSSSRAAKKSRKVGGKYENITESGESQILAKYKNYYTTFKILVKIGALDDAKVIYKHMLDFVEKEYNKDLDSMSEKEQIELMEKEINDAIGILSKTSVDIIKHYEETNQLDNMTYAYMLHNSIMDFYTLNVKFQVNKSKEETEYKVLDLNNLMRKIVGLDEERWIHVLELQDDIETTRVIKLIRDYLSGDITKMQLLAYLSAYGFKNVKWQADDKGVSYKLDPLIYLGLTPEDIVVKTDKKNGNNNIVLDENTINFLDTIKEGIQKILVEELLAYLGDDAKILIDNIKVEYIYTINKKDAPIAKYSPKDKTIYININQILNEIKKNGETDGVHFTPDLFARRFSIALYHEYAHAWLDYIKLDEEFYKTFDSVIAELKKVTNDKYAKELIDAYKNNENKDHIAKEILMEIVTTGTTLNRAIDLIPDMDAAIQSKAIKHQSTLIFLATLSMYRQKNVVTHHYILRSLFIQLERLSKAPIEIIDEVKNGEPNFQNNENNEDYRLSTFNEENRQEEQIKAKTTVSQKIAQKVQNTIDEIEEYNDTLEEIKSFVKQKHLDLALKLTETTLNTYNLLTAVSDIVEKIDNKTLIKYGEERTSLVDIPLDQFLSYFIIDLNKATNIDPDKFGYLLALRYTLLDNDYKPDIVNGVLNEENIAANNKLIKSNVIMLYTRLSNYRKYKTYDIDKNAKEGISLTEVTINKTEFKEGRSVNTLLRQEVDVAKTTETILNALGIQGDFVIFNKIREDGIEKETFIGRDKLGKYFEPEKLLQMLYPKGIIYLNPFGTASLECGIELTDFNNINTRLAIGKAINNFLFDMGIYINNLNVPVERKELLAKNITYELDLIGIYNNIVVNTARVWEIIDKTYTHQRRDVNINDKDYIKNVIADNSLMFDGTVPNLDNPDHVALIDAIATRYITLLQNIQYAKQYSAHMKEVLDIIDKIKNNSKGLKEYENYPMYKQLIDDLTNDSTLVYDIQAIARFGDISKLSNVWLAKTTVNNLTAELYSTYFRFIIEQLKRGNKIENLFNDEVRAYYDLDVLNVEELKRQVIASPKFSALLSVIDELLDKNKRVEKYDLDVPVENFIDEEYKITILNVEAAENMINAAEQSKLDGASLWSTGFDKIYRTMFGVTDNYPPKQYIFDMEQGYFGKQAGHRAIGLVNEFMEYFGLSVIMPTDSEKLQKGKTHRITKVNVATNQVQTEGGIKNAARWKGKATTQVDITINVEDMTFDDALAMFVALKELKNKNTNNETIEQYENKIKEFIQRYSIKTSIQNVQRIVEKEFHESVAGNAQIMNATGFIHIHGVGPVCGTKILDGFHSMVEGQTEIINMKSDDPSYIANVIIGRLRKIFGGDKLRVSQFIELSTLPLIEKAIVDTLENYKSLYGRGYRLPKGLMAFLDTDIFEKIDYKTLNNVLDVFNNNFMKGNVNTQLNKIANMIKLITDENTNINKIGYIAQLLGQTDCLFNLLLMQKLTYSIPSVIGILSQDVLKDDLLDAVKYRSEGAIVVLSPDLGPYSNYQEYYKAEVALLDLNDIEEKDYLSGSLILKYRQQLIRALGDTGEDNIEENILARGQETYNTLAKINEILETIMQLRAKLVGLKKFGYKTSLTEQKIANKNYDKLLVKHDKLINELAGIVESISTINKKKFVIFSKTKLLTKDTKNAFQALEILYNEMGKSDIINKLKQVADDYRKDKGLKIEPGYVLISDDLAKELFISVGDRLFSNITPTLTSFSVTGLKVVGIIPSSIYNKNTIIGSSEYLQTEGRDYDIDTVGLQIFLNAMIQDDFNIDDYREYIKTFNANTKKFLREVLKYAVNKGYLKIKEKNIDEMPIEEIFMIFSDNNKKLEMMKNFFGERKLFGDDKNIFKLPMFAKDTLKIYKYYGKDVGPTINLREHIQLVASLGLSVTKGENVIYDNGMFDPDNVGSDENMTPEEKKSMVMFYSLLAGYITDAELDFPKNDNKLHTDIEMTNAYMKIFNIKYANARAFIGALNEITSVYSNIARWLAAEDEENKYIATLERINTAKEMLEALASDEGLVTSYGVVHAANKDINSANPIFTFINKLDTDKISAADRMFVKGKVTTEGIKQAFKYIVQRSINKLLSTYEFSFENEKGEKVVYYDKDVNDFWNITINNIIDAMFTNLNSIRTYALNEILGISKDDPLYRRAQGKQVTVNYSSQLSMDIIVKLVMRYYELISNEIYYLRTLSANNYSGVSPEDLQKRLDYYTKLSNYINYIFKPVMINMLYNDRDYAIRLNASLAKQFTKYENTVIEKNNVGEKVGEMFKTFDSVGIAFREAMGMINKLSQSKKIQELRFYDPLKYKNLTDISEDIEAVNNQVQAQYKDIQQEIEDWQSYLQRELFNGIIENYSGAQAEDNSELYPDTEEDNSEKGKITELPYQRIGLTKIQTTVTTDNGQTIELYSIAGKTIRHTYMIKGGLYALALKMFPKGKHIRRKLPILDEIFYRSPILGREYTTSIDRESGLARAQITPVSKQSYTISEIVQKYESMYAELEKRDIELKNLVEKHKSASKYLDNTLIEKEQGVFYMNATDIIDYYRFNVYDKNIVLTVLNHYLDKKEIEIPASLAEDIILQLYAFNKARKSLYVDEYRGSNIMNMSLILFNNVVVYEQITREGTKIIKQHIDEFRTDRDVANITVGKEAAGLAATALAQGVKVIMHSMNLNQLLNKVSKYNYGGQRASQIAPYIDRANELVKLSVEEITNKYKEADKYIAKISNIEVSEETINEIKSGLDIPSYLNLTPYKAIEKLYNEVNRLYEGKEQNRKDTVYAIILAISQDINLQIAQNDIIYHLEGLIPVKVISAMEKLDDVKIIDYDYLQTITNRKILLNPRVIKRLLSMQPADVTTDGEKFYQDNGEDTIGFQVGSSIRLPLVLKKGQDTVYMLKVKIEGEYRWVLFRTQEEVSADNIELSEIPYIKLDTIDMPKDIKAEFDSMENMTEEEKKSFKRTVRYKMYSQHRMYNAEQLVEWIEKNNIQTYKLLSNLVNVLEDKNLINTNIEDETVFQNYKNILKYFSISKSGTPQIDINIKNIIVWDILENIIGGEDLNFTLYTYKGIPEARMGKYTKLIEAYNKSKGREIQPTVGKYDRLPQDTTQIENIEDVNIPSRIILHYDKTNPENLESLKKMLSLQLGYFGVLTSIVPGLELGASNYPINLYKFALRFSPVMYQHLVEGLETTEAQKNKVYKGESIEDIYYNLKYLDLGESIEQINKKLTKRKSQRLSITQVNTIEEEPTTNLTDISMFNSHLQDIDDLINEKVDPNDFENYLDGIRHKVRLLEITLSSGSKLPNEQNSIFERVTEVGIGRDVVEGTLTTYIEEYIQMAKELYSAYRIVAEKETARSKMHAGGGNIEDDTPVLSPDIAPKIANILGVNIAHYRANSTQYYINAVYILKIALKEIKEFVNQLTTLYEPESGIWYSLKEEFNWNKRIIDLDSKPIGFKHNNISLFGFKILDPFTGTKDINGHHITRATGRYTPIGDDLLHLNELYAYVNSKADEAIKVLNANLVQEEQDMKTIYSNFVRTTGNITVDTYEIGKDNTEQGENSGIKKTELTQDELLTQLWTGIAKSKKVAFYNSTTYNTSNKSIIKFEPNYRVLVLTNYGYKEIRTNNLDEFISKFDTIEVEKETDEIILSETIIDDQLQGTSTDYKQQSVLEEINTDVAKVEVIQKETNNTDTNEVQLSNEEVDDLLEQMGVMQSLGGIEATNPEQADNGVENVKKEQPAGLPIGTKISEHETVVGKRVVTIEGEKPQEEQNELKHLDTNENIILEPTKKMTLQGFKRIIGDENLANLILSKFYEAEYDLFTNKVIKYKAKNGNMLFKTLFSIMNHVHIEYANTIGIINNYFREMASLIEGKLPEVANHYWSTYFKLRNLSEAFAVTSAKDGHPLYKRPELNTYHDFEYAISMPVFMPKVYDINSVAFKDQYNSFAISRMLNLNDSIDFMKIKDLIQLITKEHTDPNKRFKSSYFIDRRLQTDNTVDAVDDRMISLSTFRQDLVDYIFREVNTALGYHAISIGERIKENHKVIDAIKLDMMANGKPSYFKLGLKKIEDLEEGEEVVFKVMVVFGPDKKMARNYTGYYLAQDENTITILNKSGTEIIIIHKDNIFGVNERTPKGYINVNEYSKLNEKKPFVAAKLKIKNILNILAYRYRNLILSNINKYISGFFNGVQTFIMRYAGFSYNNLINSNIHGDTNLKNELEKLDTTLKCLQSQDFAYSRVFNFYSKPKLITLLYYNYLLEIHRRLEANKINGDPLNIEKEINEVELFRERTVTRARIRRLEKKILRYNLENVKFKGIAIPTFMQLYRDALRIHKSNLAGELMTTGEVELLNTVVRGTLAAYNSITIDTAQKFALIESIAKFFVARYSKTDTPIKRFDKNNEYAYSMKTYFISIMNAFDNFARLNKNKYIKKLNKEVKKASADIIHSINTEGPVMGIFKQIKKLKILAIIFAKFNFRFIPKIFELYSLIYLIIGILSNIFFIEMAYRNGKITYSQRKVAYEEMIYKAIPELLTRIIGYQLYNTQIPMVTTYIFNTALRTFVNYEVEKKIKNEVHRTRSYSTVDDIEYRRSQIFAFVINLLGALIFTWKGTQVVGQISHEDIGVDIDFTSIFKSIMGQIPIFSAITYFSGLDKAENKFLYFLYLILTDGKYPTTRKLIQRIDGF